MAHGEAALLAVLCVATTGLMAASNFPSNPLPDEIRQPTSDYVDAPWHIGNAVSLTRGWPPADLRVSGLRLTYYFGAYVPPAADVEVTGIDPAVLMLRLDPILIDTFTVLLLFWLGNRVVPPLRAGLLTALLVLWTGDASAFAGSSSSLFSNGVCCSAFDSPTYALGLLFVLPVLVEGGRWLYRRRGGASELALLVALMLAAGLTKSQSLASLGAGAAILLALALWFRRVRRGRAAVLIGAAATIAIAVKSLAFGNAGGVLTFSPLSVVWAMPIWERGSLAAIDVLPHHILPLAVVFLGWAPILLVGAAAYLWLRVRAAEPREMWVGSVALGSLIVVLAIGAPSAIWFWYYGAVALAALAAVGLSLLALRRDDVRTWPFIGASVVVGMAGVASALMISSPQVGKFARGSTDVAPPKQADLTPQLVKGLRWLRTHTEASAIVVANNYSLLSERGAARYFYYSALGQRSVFLEGFAYTPAGWGAADGLHSPPFATRRALVDRIFARSDVAAVERVRAAYGARYLLVDRRIVGRNRPHFPSNVARRIFENHDVEIYALVR